MYDIKKPKALLDACFTAKRITESMADLPEGMKPRHIHVIDAIHELGADVRVSDVSHRLNITAIRQIARTAYLSAAARTRHDRNFFGATNQRPHCYFFIHFSNLACIFAAFCRTGYYPILPSPRIRFTKV